jgi:pyruvate kinase
MQRRAKIICTLGPSSYEEHQIEALIKAGMNIARLNFSHGTHEFYRGLINRVRHIAARMGEPVAILQDLQGPKIRTGKMTNDMIELMDGEQTIITDLSLLGTPKEFSSDYAPILNDVAVGDPVLLDDGKIVLRCVAKSEHRLHCLIEQGGLLKNNKGINLPRSATSAESLTEKDIRDVSFGAHAGVDGVALSFVRSAADVIRLRSELAATKTRPLIIAKLEKQQAIDDLNNILRVSDGVMVARGDLGVEIPPENVPLLQKRIVESAMAQGKIAVVATEMLESMITQIRPTRAEASDVANAVLDGADMLMLSAETAAGKNPVKAVEIMDRIITHVEESHRASYWLTGRRLDLGDQKEIQNTMAQGAVQACAVLKASAIVMFTNTGAIARMVSAYRPQKPVIAFVPNAEIQRALSFCWGVSAMILQAPNHTSQLIKRINDRLLETGHFEMGERVIILTKIPLLPSERTNTIHIHTLKPMGDD